MSNFSFSKKEAGDKRFDGSMDGDFTPIPSQWYAGIISKQDDIKPTNDGNGTYLPITWDITGKHHAGRKVFFNIGRTGSEGFVNMGNGALGSILDALNMEGFQAFAQVMNKPMSILVKLIPAQYEADGVTVKNKAKNEIKGIMPFNQLEKLRAEYEAKHPNGDEAPVKKAVKAAAATEIPADAGWTDDAAQTATGTTDAAPAQFEEQPWNEKDGAQKSATEAKAAVVTNVPVPDATPDAPAAAVEAWEANGWLQHPSSPAHVYKKGEPKAKTKVEVNAFYAAEKAKADAAAKAAKEAKEAAARAAAAAAEAPAVPDLDDVPSLDVPVEDAADGVPPWASEDAE